MNEKLMEEMIEETNWQKALKAVIDNRGAAGIDGMTTGELKEHVGKHAQAIRNKLLKGSYVPSPVRRVEIPKSDGGVRTLGIPTVQDRFIQQLLLQGMTPIFELRFSEHSYGFRPHRSAHEAVTAAQNFAKSGKEWVVDIDICQFFDHVNHDILMARIAKVIRDKRVLRLIGRLLRRGMMTQGVVVSSEKGTPQGGPLSPLLSNIYLDKLDKELEKRGHAFCRYADDCNIYVASQAAARRVLESMGRWIEKELQLKINTDKSDVGQVWERKFLGFQLNGKLQIEAAPKSLERFKNQVRKLWQSCQSLSSAQLRDRWCAYIRGWWNYFQLAEERRSIFNLEGWIRRHIRKCFWLRWHNAKGRTHALRKLGLRNRQLKVALSSRGAWRIAASPSLHTALANKILKQYAFLLPSDLATS